MSTFLLRYIDGEYDRVWAELVALGPAVREEPLASDAYAVARETMRRAGGNVDRIIRRLRDIGYRFEHAPVSEWVPNLAVHVPPAPDAGERIAHLEATAGMLPLSLRAWYEEVGSVSLMGRHPDWDPHAYPDPLVVEGLEGWEFEYECWQDAQEQDPEYPYPFPLPIAPDALHKQNVSGGEPYGIDLPCAGADASLLFLWQEETTFVEYLRICFQWGGFPGWASTQGERGLPPEWTPYLVRPREHLAYLSADLLPI